MDELIWQDRPRLRRPALVVALGGWSDAGEVGTWSIRWLQRNHQSQPVATIPGEGFLVLTDQRPLVRTADDGQRFITWPDYRFTHIQTPGGRDLVLLSGPEPHLRWKAFTAAVMEVVQTLGIELMVSLGGLSSLVLHSDPPKVTGSANTPELMARLGGSANVSRYEGPVGLLSVLVVACRDAGLGTVSIWGQTPHYAQASPNRAVGVAVLERLGHLLDVPFDLREAKDRAARFTAELDAAVAKDPEAARYVRRLAEQLRSAGPNPAQPEEELPSSEGIIADLDDFFRKGRPDGQ